MGSQKDCSLTKKPMKVGEALIRAVQQALYQSRLVIGVLEVATFLRRRDDMQTLCCIIQNNEQADSMDYVQLKLVEAYCREHSIRLIKVENCEHLLDQARTAITKDSEQNDDACGRQENTHLESESKSGISCVLVKTPTDADITIEEDFIISYHDTYRHCTDKNFPCIKLPTDTN